MVAHTCCARMKENKPLRGKKLRIVTALDLSKYRKQIIKHRLLHTCAPISE